MARFPCSTGQYELKEVGSIYDGRGAGGGYSGNVTLTEDADVIMAGLYWNGVGVMTFYINGQVVNASSPGATVYGGYGGIFRLDRKLHAGDVISTNTSSGAAGVGGCILQLEIFKYG